MRKILNLTMHEATEGQKKIGVFEPTSKKDIKWALTVDAKTNIKERAEILAETADVECRDERGNLITPYVMIGGHFALVEVLVQELRKRGLKPIYAHTDRKTVEVQKEDGTVEKKSIFEQTGWWVEGSYIPMDKL